MAGVEERPRFLLRATSHRRTADSRAGFRAADPGTRHARLHPLADHAALELGEHAEHLKHRPPSRRAGVEALLVQIEVDLLGVQFAEEAKQIDQAAAKSIHCPGCDHVDLTARDSTEQRLHCWALLARQAAADAVVVEDLDDDPAVPLCHVLQLADLVVGGLIVRGGGAGIDGDALGHGGDYGADGAP
jgi:hypothetical protein